MKDIFLASKYIVYLLTQEPDLQNKFNNITIFFMRAEFILNRIPSIIYKNIDWLCIV